MIWIQIWIRTCILSVPQQGLWTECRWQVPASTEEDHLLVFTRCKRILHMLKLPDAEAQKRVRSQRFVSGHLEESRIQYRRSGQQHAWEASTLDWRRRNWGAWHVAGGWRRAWCKVLQKEGGNRATRAAVWWATWGVAWGASTLAPELPGGTDSEGPC